jgi:serine/threonine protein kinase
VITGRARGFPLCITDWSDARIHDTASPGPVITQRAYAAPELLEGTSIDSADSADSALPSGGQRARVEPGLAIDDRVDVFSLGVMAYQALTGVVPTVASRALDNAQLVPTEVRCPEAPPELTSLVDQMLAPDRWDRPSSAEIHAELLQLALELAPPPPRPPSELRIRRPRWTPSVQFADHDSQASAEGETPADDTSEKPS